MTTLRLRLGTRASALARWQAEWVAAQLTSRGVEVELVPIATRGDVRNRESIENIGSPGVFTKELERALLDERIDVAVHSLKDLPTDPVAGLCLPAVPERESPRDVLISRHGLLLDRLPAAATVGTGSLRRRAQLLHARADLVMRDVRGNVDTRLKKLADGEFDALVLAHAGLVRLGLDDQITEILKPARMLPAVGQGALAIEARA
ncbi:MAG: hydroxymethylbilane synthase, partial [Pirellulales bacterium]